MADPLDDRDRTSAPGREPLRDANDPMRREGGMDPRLHDRATPVATYTKRRSWLPFALLALLAVAAIALFTRNRDRTVASREEDAASVASGVGAAAGPGVTATAGGEVGAAAGMLPVAAILDAPAQYGGQTVQGTVRVTEVVSDRGFWIEENGRRMFAVLGEKGAGTDAAEHHTDIRAGQTLRLSGHVFTRADQAGRLEEETRRIIADQPAYLHVMPQDVQLATP